MPHGVLRPKQLKGNDLGSIGHCFEPLETAFSGSELPLECRLAAWAAPKMALQMASVGRMSSFGPKTICG